MAIEGVHPGEALAAPTDEILPRAVNAGVTDEVVTTDKAGGTDVAPEGSVGQVRLYV